MTLFFSFVVRFLRACFRFGPWPWNIVVGVCLLALTVGVMKAATDYALAWASAHWLLVVPAVVFVAAFWLAALSRRQSSPGSSLSWLGRLFASDATLAAEALALAGIKCADGSAPRVRSRRDGSALLLFIETPTGCHDGEVVTRGPVIATALRAVQVSHDAGLSMPGRVCLRVQASDALNETRTANRTTGHLAAVPVGWAEDGHTVAASLDSATVLVGGSPGSGKSIAVWSLLLGALRDPRTGLVVLDLKPSAIETAAIHDRAEAVADNTRDALEVLGRVWQHITTTNAWLRSRGLAKVPEDYPRLLIVVDEAAELAWDDDGKEAAQLLQRIVAVGRASGVSVVMATQKPSGSVIPTDLRDLFGQRLCFRVGNRAQAETVLGPLDQGVEPWNISRELPGVGYAVGTAGETVAVRFRGYALTDEARDAEARALVGAWVSIGCPKVLPPKPWEARCEGVRDEYNESDEAAETAPKRRRRR